MAKNTYGTGCFLLYNVGDKPVISKHGLLGTVGFQLGRDRKPVYALEGSVAVAGSGVSFLMNNLGFFRDSRKVSDLAASVPDNGGCIFVTAFSGLFAPYWIDDAQGTICKLTSPRRQDSFANVSQGVSPPTHKKGTLPVQPWKQLVSKQRLSSTPWQWTVARV
jgi:glycerol kinase